MISELDLIYEKKRYNNNIKIIIPSTRTGFGLSKGFKVSKIYINFDSF